MNRLNLRDHPLLTAARALISPTVLAAAGMVFDDKGHLLLVRHSYMHEWSLPGGCVNRGEPTTAALRRELQEEIGLTGGDAAFLGLYTRPTGWATSVVALYRITGAAIAFQPNWEIREIVWTDPAMPPPDTHAATLRRIAELRGTPISDYW